ncbi:MAG: PKD domain-containing protein, partial [Deltaproteobacteria bacterium]|nr:PKD domain-containing protein [Deltaproteobacteria bacterium]
MRGSGKHRASKWLGVSAGLLLYAVFSFSGCSSCSKKPPHPAPGKPPIIDSFTVTSGGQITNSSYIPFSAAAPLTAFTFTVVAHSPSPQTPIVSYEWSFMDDQYGNPNFILTTTSPTAAYTYTQTNSYLVTVRVTDSKGNFTDSTNCNDAVGTGCLLSIYPRTLISLLLVPTTSLYNPVPLQVSVQAKVVPTTPGASVSRYEWDCGNGTVFTDTDPATFTYQDPYTINLGTCTYDSIGTYTLTAKVTDSLGYFTSASLQATGEVSIAPLSMYQLDGQGYNVTFKNNYAYLADGTAGLKIIDMSNPSSPVLIGRYWDPYALPVYGCSPFGSYLYCAWKTTVYIFDISDPASPRLVSRADKPPGVQQFKDVEKVIVTDISGTDYLFAPDRQSGTISIFDLSNFLSYFSQPTWITDTAPIWIPGSPTPAGVYDMFITSTTGVNPTYYAYVAAYTGGFAIYNVSDPTNITGTTGYMYPINYPSTPYDGYTGVTLTDTNYAYIADSIYGVLLVDVSDPTNPHFDGLGIPIMSGNCSGR